MIDWGNVPSWAAFLAASTAAIFTWRALVRERRRDAQRQKDSRRSEAERFGAWIGRDESFQSQFEGDFHVKLRNASEQPIYDVRFQILNLREPRDKAFTASLPVVPPADKAQDFRLGPDMQSRLRVITQQTQALRESSPGFGLEVSFRDSAGRRWRRSTDGRLEESVK